MIDIEVKKTISEKVETELIKKVIDFASDNGLTVSNLEDAMKKVIQHFNDNAVLEKEG